MKVYVIGAKVRNGVTKTTNEPYNKVVIDYVYDVNGEQSVDTEWVPCEMLNGYIPQRGDVLEFEYGKRGYLNSVTPVLDLKCKFSVFPVATSEN